MEQFIKELEQEKITEEDNYFQVTGLSDTILKKVEEKTLDDFDSLTWGDFKIDELLDKKTIKGVPKSDENLSENNNGYYIHGQNLKLC